jgi:hypothetical protein
MHLTTQSFLPAIISILAKKQGGLHEDVLRKKKQCEQSPTNIAMDIKKNGSARWLFQLYSYSIQCFAHIQAPHSTNNHSP